MSSEPAFIVAYDGAVATITLNKPKRLNAMTIDMYKQLGNILREIATHDEVVATVITGNGRFFSAGADVMGFQSDDGSRPTYDTDRETWLHNFVLNNLDTTKAFYEHPKILIAALNGPAVGLSAALIAHADFIYVAESAYILTPFSSLGLVAEGGASLMFVKRMGLSKANEALLLSRKISSADLLQCGFANRIFPDEGFHEAVMAKVKDDFGGHLINDSIFGIKKLIREPFHREMHNTNVTEVYAGMARFLSGVPQGEFMKMASGEKRHKL